MKDLSLAVDSNFVVRGLGLTGPTQPNDANRAVFVSEASLDTAIGSIHKTADKPHLTMNDKVFAARYSLAGNIIVPSSVEALAVENTLPDDTWSKDGIREWLASNGVTYSNNAFNNMSKDELLDAVLDVNSTS